MIQTLNILIVSHFQNIDPNKDGKMVKGMFDLKNEIRIITSLDDIFE
jgi:hypothetical protein